MYNMFSCNVAGAQEIDRNATITLNCSMKVKPASPVLEKLLSKFGYIAFAKGSWCKLVLAWDVVAIKPGELVFQPIGVALVSTKTLQVGKGPQSILEQAIWAFCNFVWLNLEQNSCCSGSERWV